MTTPFTVSFRELDLLTTAVAQSLRTRGILPGERVGLLLPPGPAYPVLLLSLLRAGAIAVPISTRLPKSLVPGLLGRIGCQRLITDSSDQPNCASELSAIDMAEIFLSSGDVNLLGEGVAQAGVMVPPFDPTADATIVFTSGSTGAPKAALHSFENHWSSAVGANRNIPLRPGDRWLLSLPPWHVGGLAVIFRCLLGGAAIAIAGKDEPLPDAIAGLGAMLIAGVWMFIGLATNGAVGFTLLPR